MRIRRAKRMPWKLNKGSSLITVLAVITIVMVVVFSVLAMAYRYYMSESGSIYRQKGDEAARSLSEELGNELTMAHYTSAAEAEAAEGLWQYLREYMGQPGWSYYDSGRFEERVPYTSGTDIYEVDLSGVAKAAGIDAAKKTFVLQADTSSDADLDAEVPKTEVALYWEPGKYNNRLQGSYVYIEVSCRMGDHVTVITKRYRMASAAFPEGGGSQDKNEKGYYQYQNWIWTYDREL